MIKILSGRRAWETCINWTNCPGRQDDLNALAERKARKEKTKSRDDDE
jgi:hypothetical protein